MRRYSKALQEYERALAREPEYASAHYNKGNALSSLRCYPQAVASYDRALKAGPSNTAAWINRAFTLDANSLAAWQGKALTLRALRRPSEAEGAERRARVGRITTAVC
jgi:tetratricopeptide (TPR) repeat protein